jgi:hypothetical protein
MRHDRWHDVVIPIALVVGPWLSSGCCQYPERCDQTPSPRPAGSHRSPGKKYPAGLRGSEPTWRELPVLAVDVRKGRAERHLIVKTRTPTDGWTVRVKALSVKDGSEAELQVVGLAPAAAEERNIEEQTVYREIPLGPEVEHVIVRGSDGSLLMDVE